jgi:hypothetical protein
MGGAELAIWGSPERNGYVGYVGPENSSASNAHSGVAARIFRLLSFWPDHSCGPNASLGRPVLVTLTALRSPLDDEPVGDHQRSDEHDSDQPNTDQATESLHKCPHRDGQVGRLLRPGTMEHAGSARSSRMHHSRRAAERTSTHRSSVSCNWRSKFWAVEYTRSSNLLTSVSKPH